MNQYVKVETRRSGDYAYEISPVYDPRIKNTRPSKRYLGKVIGYDQAGRPIVGPKWIKKSVLKKLLEENDAPGNLLPFLQCLISNDHYSVPDNDSFHENSAIPRRVDQSFFYINRYVEGLRRNVEFFVSPSDPRNVFLNIDTMRVGVQFKDRPVTIFITDSESNMAKINNLRAVVIRSAAYRKEKPVLKILGNFVYSSKNLALGSNQRNSILSVLLFNSFVDLVEAHNDFNTSIIKSFEFTFKKMIDNCFNGRKPPEIALASSVKEIRKMASYLDL